MSMESQHLQGVRWLDPSTQTDQRVNVWIENDQIQAIDRVSEDSPPDSPVRAADHLILAPGLVDLHSTSGEPGYEDRETLAQLAQAAIAGGFTQVALLPDGHPVLDNPATLSLLQQKQALLNLPLSPQFHFWGSLTLGAQGDHLGELADLGKAGVVGFSDGKPIQNLSLVRRALEYLAPLQTPLALVPVNLALRGNGVMRDGTLALQCGLPGEPVMAETTAIATLIELLSEIPTPLHLLRVSTQRGVELIAAAQAQGLPLTASTTWMHLLLNTSNVLNYDPNLRLDPPLGNETDRLALIAGVKAGTLTAIAVDHSAYSYEEKTLAFAEAPPGAIGLELALPCLWQGLVETGHLTALELWQALSINPLRSLGLTPDPSHWLLFDPAQSWLVNGENLKTPARNTPWLGQTIRGKVLGIFSWP